MATANPSVIDQLMQAVGLKRQPKTATTNTPTFRPQQKDQVLSVPAYRDHLSALYDNRFAQNSQDLLQTLFKQDPDVSAAVASYLTLANTPMTWLVYDPEGEIDLEATKLLGKLIHVLTRPTDYTLGFQLKPNLEMICREFRYMLLLRGAIGVELVFDKKYVPSRLQQVDMKSIRWFEKETGVYKPAQQVEGENEPRSLDIPSFFVAFHRRDPTNIYAESDFVSAINVVAARQQVINDLYRIMQVTGYPRFSIKILEEVLMKNAPANLADDPQGLQTWAQGQLNLIASSWADIRADQPMVHFDSVEPSVINEKNPGAGLDITAVIEVLNAQNQAALKTMATVIGRGNAGVNTASVEARIAAMNADELNVPLKQMFGQAFTFLLNAFGVPGYVEVSFAPAELRPDLELEPQRTLKAARLREDLSHGLITDTEYHLGIYGRLPPESAPELSGTGFYGQKAEVRTDDVSPNANSGSLERSLTPVGGASAARSNGVKKSSKAVKAALALLNLE